MNVRLTVAAAAATVLASIALYPLMAGGTWFWAGVGAVIVVAAIGAATRRRAIPAIVCFAAAIAGLFLYLNVVFARHQSLAGLVPTGASVHHLRELVAQATAETSKYAPPVPDRPGIVLLTAAGIGLVAALTDVLAVRLHRPAIAGLPLLVLFCVPLTTDVRPGAVGGTLVFCAGWSAIWACFPPTAGTGCGCGAAWCTPGSDEDNEGPDIRPLAAAGRRIGSAAVVLALFLPLLVPGLRQHRLFPGTGGAAAPAGTTARSRSPSRWTRSTPNCTRRQPQTILTYHTTAGAAALPPGVRAGPSRRQQQRVDHDATRRPHLAEARDHARAPGLQPQTYSLPVREQIDLGRNLANSASVSYLPVPFPAQQVQVGGSWRVDPDSLTVLGTNVRLAGLHYSVNAKDLNPSPQALRHAGPPPPGVERTSPSRRCTRGSAPGPQADRAPDQPIRQGRRDPEVVHEAGQLHLLPPA